MTTLAPQRRAPRSPDVGSRETAPVGPAAHTQQETIQGPEAKVAVDVYLAAATHEAEDAGGTEDFTHCSGLRLVGQVGGKAVGMGIQPGVQSCGAGTKDLHMLAVGIWDSERPSTLLWKLTGIL